MGRGGPGPITGTRVCRAGGYHEAFISVEGSQK